MGMRLQYLLAAGVRKRLRAKLACNTVLSILRTLEAKGLPGVDSLNFRDSTPYGVLHLEQAGGNRQID
jgi:hypothetical protein